MTALATNVAAFDPATQYRVATIDRTLQAAFKNVYASLLQLQAARDQFTALGLAGQWPPAGVDWVHQERDASTKQEQTDMDTMITHVLATVLGIGTTATTTATVAPMWKRYAR